MLKRCLSLAQRVLVADDVDYYRRSPRSVSIKTPEQPMSTTRR